MARRSAARRTAVNQQACVDRRAATGGAASYMRKTARGGAFRRKSALIRAPFAVGTQETGGMLRLC